MNQLFIETKINDQYSKLSIESILIEIFTTINERKNNDLKKPAWANKLKDLLIEEKADFSLKSLASQLEIHPVHLSREFNRYFGASLGHYIRLLKLNKAFCLIVDNQLSMTEICYECGFFDQSHFISNFKRVYNTTPSKILKNISNC